MPGRVEGPPPPRDVAPAPPPEAPPPADTDALTQEEANRAFGVGGLISTGA